VTTVTDGRSETKHTGWQGASSEGWPNVKARANQVNRRGLVRAAMAAVTAGYGIACSKVKSPWRFLSVDEARALAAICDQIITPDQEPGAAWAGVVSYVDRQLCGPFRHLRKTYRQGVAGVDESSRAHEGGDHVSVGSCGLCLATRFNAGSC
jgi:hypothetical protein